MAHGREGESVNFFQLEKLSFACTKIKEFSHENEDSEVRNPLLLFYATTAAGSLSSTTTTATHYDHTSNISRNPVFDVCGASLT